MAVRDQITIDNVLSYAGAGIAVARTMHRLAREGYQSTVIPSRGAVPVMNIAQSYYRSVLQPFMSREDRVRNIGERFGPITLTFSAPFTADAGQMGVAGLETAQIRAYWARVIAAITRGETDDPSYRFYRFVRDEVCKVGHHDALERQMRSPRLIFIDTVVSGRAVAEIVDAFDREGMNEIHYILLLDENGSRMDPKYSWQIRQIADKGRATLIKVPSLFTEDQGPAVSGIWSVVFPSLMDLARTEGGFKDGIVGAGLYYFEVSCRKDNSNLPLTVANSKLDLMLRTAMFAAAKPDDIAEDYDFLSTGFANEAAMLECFALSETNRPPLEHFLEKYLQHVEHHGLFDQISTEQMARPKVLAGCAGMNADIDVSSSHCLRLNLGEDEAARLLRRFNETLKQPYWEDDECIRRASAPR